MKQTKLLIDFNNLAIRYFFSKPVSGFSTLPEYVLWRYLIIESVYKYSVKFKANKVVCAIDDRQSWRKIVFDRYKESRKTKRDKTDVDWDTFYKQLERLINDIKENIPFRTIKVNKAEADDIIGVLSLNSDDNVVIISNDEDYIQLCSQNVKLFNPNKQDFVECKDTENFIIEKCLLGQAKDDIFNIITPIDWGLTEETKGKRKPGFGPKRLEKVMKEGYREFLLKNNLIERFKLNRKLIDLKLIPKTIKDKIIQEYENYVLPKPDNIYKFFKEQKYNGFLDDFERVERNLLMLY